jgi:hypothetical protein
MKNIFREFGAFLRDKRAQITTRAKVQVVRYDPTYGAQVSEDEIEVIDFEALCSAIDEFGEMLRERDSV